MEEGTVVYHELFRNKLSNDPHTAANGPLGFKSKSLNFFSEYINMQSTKLQSHF